MSPLVDSHSVDDKVDESRVTSCRKDIGEPAGKIRHYIRGHVFIVWSCSHMDWWEQVCVVKHDMLQCWTNFVFIDLNHHLKYIIMIKLHPSIDLEVIVEEPTLTMAE